MGRLFFLFFTILLTILAVVISTYNVDSASVDLYLETYDLPLSIIILFAFIAGVFGLFGWAFAGLAIAEIVGIIEELV